MRYLPLAILLGVVSACNAFLGMNEVEHSKADGGVENSSAGALAAGGATESELSGGMPTMAASASGGEPASAGKPEGGGISGASAAAGASSDDVDCNLAGTTKDTAFDFQELGTLETCPSNTVVDTKGDFYRFELSENAVLTYTLNPKVGRLTGSFYRDQTQIDLMHPLFVVDTTSTPISGSVNLEQGVYYLRTVGPAGKVLYALALGAAPYAPEPTPEPPGEDQDNALELGVIGGLKTIGGYVGSTDAEDYYRIEAPRNLTAVFSLERVLGQAKYRIYEESAQVNLEMPVWDSAWASPTNAAYHEEVLEKRAYLVRVTTSNPPLGSLYELAISVKDQ